MPGTYKAIGINLKGTSLGESDRILTVLTREFGLIRAVAPGARKHQSLLRGRSGLFVVNELLIARGKNLDKILQAESIESFPSLSQDLRKLTVGQYLAEMALYQALTDQPQEELFNLLHQHLTQLAQQPAPESLLSLLQGMLHLLALAGVAPQVHRCCLTQETIAPDFGDRPAPVGFSAIAGGTLYLAALKKHPPLPPAKSPVSESHSSRRPAPSSDRQHGKVVDGDATTATVVPPSSECRNVITPLNALQLALLQALAQPSLLQVDEACHVALEVPLRVNLADPVWLSLERLLRHYTQYHFERSIRSAALIDSCFLPLPRFFSDS